MSRPRETVHRGSVLASGLLIDVRLAGEEGARERVLRLRENGLTAFRHDERLVVRFSEPVRLSCDASAGAPLVRFGKVLSTAPLEEEIAGALSMGGDAVARVEGGELSVRPLLASEREDLASWVDTSSFEVARDVSSLGNIAAPPVLREAPAATDVRAPLGVPALAAEGALVLAALTKGAAGHDGRRATHGRDLSTIFRTLRGALAAAGRTLAGLFARRSALPSAERAPGTGKGLAAIPDTKPREPGWLSRAAALLRHAVARLLVWSHVAPFVGRQHAKYLERMLEMFDAGDLEAALRHAIPLSEGVQQALSSPALLPPRARSDLTIVPQHEAASTSLTLGGDLFSVLRQTYRRAFEHLVAQGDFEKAAFVLAELLQASEEAVSFLERHGRWKLAAEIAEARGLPPGLVIRQWFLAGERERAIQIARRTGAFANAVQRLEATHRDQANELRILWANALAEGGAYSAAVDTVWKIEGARGLVGEWIDRALAVGGVSGARMLVKKLLLSPSSFAEVLERAEALLVDEDEDASGLRVALAQELLRGEGHLGTRRLAARVARALLGNTQDTNAAQLGRRLLDQGGDGLLRADVTTGQTKKRETRASIAPSVSIQANAITDVGKMRSLNEDAVLASSLAEGVAAAQRADGFPSAQRGHLDADAGRVGVVLGVFDGTGGYAAGDTASVLVRKLVFEGLHRDFATHGGDVTRWAGVLARAIEGAGRAVHRRAIDDQRQRGSGSTATVATLVGQTLLVAQIGDSRAYVLRKDALVQVTTDHSLVNQLLADGKLTPEEAETSEYRNIITRALGVAEEVSPDLTSIELRRGDVILLCSDGLSGLVKDPAIREILRGRKPLDATRALVDAANAAGGHDNISVVVAEVGWAGLAPASVDDPVRVVPLERATLEAGDAALGAPLLARPTPLRIRRAAEDRGGIAVLDAALLADGKMLVALGEIGAWLLARDGRVLARFGEPADALVLSSHGDRAILAARRGDALRLARLDVPTRRVKTWCDARIDVFAHDFDGLCWYVGHGRTLFAINATAEGWERDWSLEHEKVHCLARDTGQLSVVFSSPTEQAEVWTLEDASRTVRHRRPVESMRPMAVAPSGVSLALPFPLTESAKVVPGVLVAGDWNVLDLEGDWAQGDAALHGAPSLTEAWVLLTEPLEPTGTRVYLCDVKTRRQRLIVELEGATMVRARIQGEHVVIADTAGRVLVISLRDGRVVREARVG